MRTQTITFDNRTISVYESVGQGPSALLVHGNSSSGLSYLHQLDSELGEKYRLVAMDLPGHGSSSWAADPASTYTVPGYADVVLSVAEQLGLMNGVFVGWSLGGNILLEASDRLPRAAGLMIIGTAPLGLPPALADAFFPHPAFGFNFQASLSEEDIEAFARALFRPGVDQVSGYVADIRRADGRARQAIGASFQTGGYRDEIAIVGQLSTPLAVVYGEQEQFVNTNYADGLTIPSLWRGEVIVIPDAGHIPHWEQPAVLNPLLDAFMTEAAK